MVNDNECGVRMKKRVLCYDVATFYKCSVIWLSRPGWGKVIILKVKISKEGLGGL